MLNFSCKDAKERHSTAPKITELKYFIVINTYESIGGGGGEGERIHYYETLMIHDVVQNSKSEDF